MKINSFLKISLIIPLIFFTIILLSPIALASGSEKNFTNNTTMTSNESANDSEQTDKANNIIQGKNDTNGLSSSELCLSLNENLKWFFSFEKLNFIDDPYENKYYYNYRATFGIHIVL